MQKESAENFQNLVYRISHDMGAPLRHINSFTTLLYEKYEDQFNAEGKQWLEYIQSSNSKAQAMLEGLLQYSRISAENYSLESLDLNTIANSTITQQNDIIKEKNAQIKIQELPTIHAVKQHWFTLFSALIGNSLTYTSEIQKPVINISYKTDADNRLHLKFEDNGIGVEEKYYNEITTLFRRLHCDTDYPGIGMGLTLSERILHFYNGEISFNKSTLGGLTVECSLPSKPDIN